MDEKPYLFREDSTEYSYCFESISQKASLQKLVLFTATDIRNVFNLALVDQLPSGELSDSVVSNNEDMPIVLATVFRIIDEFLNRFPAFIAFFQGSDQRRNRLSRMVLGKELDKLTTRFDVRGYDGNRFVIFERNQSYESFLIRK